MGMTIDAIINDCKQSIIQSKSFIKVHQKNMEIGEIKEYQYYIERDKLIIHIMRKYQKIEQIVKEWGNSGLIQNQLYDLIKGVLEDGKVD